MLELLAGVSLFTALLMLLVLLVLLARRALVPVGRVSVVVNGRKTLEAERGWRLDEALLHGGVHLASACGGAGTCGLCRVRVTQGGGEPLPLEVDRFSRRERADGARLACQVTLKQDITVEVPDGILDVRPIVTSVRSTRQVATFMKEIVLALPPEESLTFRAGSFVQVAVPPYRLAYRDLDVPEVYRADWDRLDLWRHVASCGEATTRAYSLANHPGEPGLLMLVVRLATPPPGARPDVPPGVGSSYLFGLRVGDRVTVSGPYGSFFAEDSEREMVFVGGGAGMAPMRAHILDQVERRRTTRRISFWYGARSLKELFYAEVFERLAREHANFTWHVALSEPRPEDAWKGPTGFIHEVLEREHLRAHPAPEAAEYYLCGPPLMIRAVTHLLLSLGVEPQDIHADDFGG